MAALVKYVDGVAVGCFSLEELSTCIGRAEASDICLTDKFVSKQHAVIEARKIADSTAFFLRDLNSTNHTYVNGAAIERIRLQDNDKIQIGEEAFVFRLLQDDATENAELSAFPGQESQVDKLKQQMQDAPRTNRMFSRRLKLF